MIEYVQHKMHMSGLLRLRFQKTFFIKKFSNIFLSKKCYMPNANVCMLYFQHSIRQQMLNLVCITSSIRLLNGAYIWVKQPQYVILKCIIQYMGKIATICYTVMYYVILLYLVCHSLTKFCNMQHYMLLYTHANSFFTII